MPVTLVATTREEEPRTSVFDSNEPEPEVAPPPVWALQLMKSELKGCLLLPGLMPLESRSEAEALDVNVSVVSPVCTLTVTCWTPVYVTLSNEVSTCSVGETMVTAIVAVWPVRLSKQPKPKAPLLEMEELSVPLNWKV